MIINSPTSTIAFYIFNYPIKFYGLILTCAIVFGYFLSYFTFKKYNSKAETDFFEDLFPITVVFSIIGARLFYVIGEFSYYKNNLAEIFMVNHGGISIYGAIIFGILTIYFYSKFKKQNFKKYLDYFALFMPLSQAIGRWGNFFNQEAYGKPANGFLKLYIDKFHRTSENLDISYYEPTFLYESILDLIIFFILLFIFFKFKNKPNFKVGTIVLIYLILYSFVRIVVENLRIDSVLNVLDVPIASIISIIILSISAILLFILYKKWTSKIH